jgi:two-component system, cell cycle sensor histidine kinase and response regulator CckA
MAAKILLVDDDSEILVVLRGALAIYGHTVLGTADPAEALDIIGREPDLDLLVTDVLMPAMDGLTLSHRAIALRPGLRVIYISGYAGELWRKIGPVPSAQLLVKPFGVTALVGAIDRLMGGRP